MQRFAHARRGAAFLARRPTPEACAKIADASGHTPAHEHEGLSSIFLYGRIPDFSHSVRKQSACFPLSYGRIRSYWLYCCKESFCFTAESEEKTFASVRSILFCTAIMGEFFFLSVKSRTSCANGNGHSPGPVISRCVACVLAIHAQVLGVGRKGLMAAPRPPCAWQHTGNPQLMNSPGWQGVRHTEEHFTKASLHPFQAITMVWYAQKRLNQ